MAAERGQPKTPWEKGRGHRQARHPWHGHAARGEPARPRALPAASPLPPRGLQPGSPGTSSASAAQQQVPLQALEKPRLRNQRTLFSQAQTTKKTCLSLRFSKGYRKQKGPKPSTSVQKHSRCSGWNFLLKVGAHEHGSSALPQEPWLRSLHQTNLGCYLVSVLALQLLFNPCATLRASCPLSTACGRHPEGREQCHWGTCPPGAPLSSWPFQHDPIYSLFPCGDKGWTYIWQQTYWPNKPAEAPPFLFLSPRPSCSQLAARGAVLVARGRQAGQITIFLLGTSQAEQFLAQSPRSATRCSATTPAGAGPGGGISLSHHQIQVCSPDRPRATITPAHSWPLVCLPCYAQAYAKWSCQVTASPKVSLVSPAPRLDLFYCYKSFLGNKSLSSTQELLN